MAVSDDLSVYMNDDSKSSIVCLKYLLQQANICSNLPNDLTFRLSTNKEIFSSCLSISIFPECYPKVSKKIQAWLLQWIVTHNDNSRAWGGSSFLRRRRLKFVMKFIVHPAGVAVAQWLKVLNLLLKVPGPPTPASFPLGPLGKALTHLCIACPAVKFERRWSSAFNSCKALPLYVSGAIQLSCIICLKCNV